MNETVTLSAPLVPASGLAFVSGLSVDTVPNLSLRDLDAALALLIGEREVKRSHGDYVWVTVDVHGKHTGWEPLPVLSKSLNAMARVEERLLQRPNAECIYWDCLSQQVGGPLPAMNIIRALPMDRARACLTAELRIRGDK